MHPILSSHDANFRLAQRRRGGRRWVQGVSHREKVHLLIVDFGEAMEVEVPVPSFIADVESAKGGVGGGPFCKHVLVVGHRGRSGCSRTAPLALEYFPRRLTLHRQVQGKGLGFFKEVGHRGVFGKRRNNHYQTAVSESALRESPGSWPARTDTARTLQTPRLPAFGKTLRPATSKVRSLFLAAASISAHHDKRKAR